MKFFAYRSNNSKFNSKAIDKNKLIYFGYTYYPDVCPFDILKLSHFIDKNPEILQNLKFIFITVDPEEINQIKLEAFSKTSIPQ